GGVQVGGQGVLVPAGGLHPEVGDGPGGVAVGPGEEGGEPGRGVGEGPLPGRAARGQEATVQGGLVCGAGTSVTGCAGTWVTPHRVGWPPKGGAPCPGRSTPCPSNDPPSSMPPAPPA